MGDEEIGTSLDAIIKIFCCFHGRDLFIKHYTTMLSKRLLNQSTVSDDAEQLMINKLQVECGHNTVNKIKTMFADMRQSKLTVEQYHDTMCKGSKMVNGIEFNV